MRSLRVVALGLAVILVALLAPKEGLARSKRLGVSPHLSADGCPACHDATSGPAPGAVKPIEAACKVCHPDADMHPIGMAPVAVKVPSTFPLENGKVSCATCHSNPSCDHKRPTAAPFLTGGVPEKKVEFCYRCHASTSKARTSPHEPPEKGKADGTCAVCHSAIPPEGSTVANASLRLAPKQACTTCHPDAVHAGAREHVGSKIDHPLSPEAAKALPLGPDGDINCWTCHDVHTFGRSKPTKPSALAQSIQRLRTTGLTVPEKKADKVDDPMMALPVNDGTLCRACHGDGPS